MEEPDWLPFAFLAGFPVFWVLICQLLGWMGGWRRLAEHYPHSGAAPSGSSWFRSGKMGWVNYGNCLVVGSTPTGLYLATLLPFRPGHAPLSIPWGEIQAESAGGWLKHVRLRFARAPSVGVRLYGRYPEIVQLASGVVSPGEIQGST